MSPYPHYTHLRCRCRCPRARRARRRRCRCICVSVVLEHHAARGERRAAFLYPGSAAGRHYAARRRPHYAELGARARTHRRFVARVPLVERATAVLYPGAAAGRHCRSARRSARAGVTVDRPAALSSLASLSLRSLGARARMPRRFVARAVGRLLYPGAPPPVVIFTLRVLGAGRARPLLSLLALA